MSAASDTTIKSSLSGYIKKFCYERRDEPFTLKSGKKSRDYFDMRKLTYDSGACAAAAQLILSEMGIDIFSRVENSSGIGFAVFGGLGAAPLACAFPDFSPVAVREKEKEYGVTGRVVFSSVFAERYPDKRSILVEDTMTTAGSMIDTAAAAMAAGFNIDRAFVILDREEGGREKWENHFPKIPLTALFSRSDIVGGFTGG